MRYTLKESIGDMMNRDNTSVSNKGLFELLSKSGVNAVPDSIDDQKMQKIRESLAEILAIEEIVDFSKDPKGYVIMKKNAFPFNAKEKDISVRLCEKMKLDENHYLMPIYYVDENHETKGMFFALNKYLNEGIQKSFIKVKGYKDPYIAEIIRLDDKIVIENHGFLKSSFESMVKFYKEGGLAVKRIVESSPFYDLNTAK